MNKSRSISGTPWHVEGLEMATGIIKRRIDQGIYLKALKQFKKLLSK